MIVGVFPGVWDLLHVGHCSALEGAKSQCDTLIVALQTDPTIDRDYKNKPVQSVMERYFQLNACKFVNEIIPYDTEKDLENLYGFLTFNIRFIGYDYANGNKIQTGDEICEKRNKKTMYLSRYHDYSSTELKDRIYQNRFFSKEYNNK